MRAAAHVGPDEASTWTPPVEIDAAGVVRRRKVLDVIFILATIGFFAINVAFAAGCDRLMGTGRGGR